MTYISNKSRKWTPFCHIMNGSPGRTKNLNILLCNSKNCPKNAQPIIKSPTNAASPEPILFFFSEQVLIKTG